MARAAARKAGILLFSLLSFGLAVVADGGLAAFARLVPGLY